jgi:hypothetical protein
LSREPPNGRTRKRPDVTHVLVKCETAPKLRKDGYRKRHRMVEVSWNVFDSSGQCGEVFVVNSYEVEDAVDDHGNG